VNYERPDAKWLEWTIVSLLVLLVLVGTVVYAGLLMSPKAARDAKSDVTPVEPVQAVVPVPVVEKKTEPPAPSPAKPKPAELPYESPYKNIREAAAKGTVRDIRYLLDRENDINSADEEGMTPLHKAAEQGNVEVVKFLVDQGANVRAANNMGRTPQDFAQLDEIQAIFLAAIQDYESPYGNIFEAAEKGTPFDVLFFISKGVDVNAKNDIGRSPLNVAAVHNSNVDVLRVLISHGADIHSRSNDPGDSPLDSAAYYNPNLEVLSFLVSKGGDVNAKNNAGNTPLILAAVHNPNAEL
jgi:ankyrin repeat protein